MKTIGIYFLQGHPRPGYRLASLMYKHQRFETLQTIRFRQPDDVFGMIYESVTQENREERKEKQVATKYQPRV